MTTKKTAVLIFDSFQNEKGTGCSFLAPEELYSELTKSIVKKVQKTGLDYFHYTELKQEGSTFGQRFSNAINAVYQKGYNTVITIGNDVPDLEVRHILQAKKELDTNTFVLGPSYDGGFYLMGLQEEYFDSNRFEEFSWNTAKVASEIKNYIKQFTSKLVTLNYLYDIDSLSDLKRVFKVLSISKKRLRLIIQKLLNVEVSKAIYIAINRLLHTLTIFFNKGSPVQYSLILNDIKTTY